MNIFFCKFKGRSIERFHSRDQHLYKFMGTKEGVYIRKEINSWPCVLQQVWRILVLCQWKNNHQVANILIQIIKNSTQFCDILWKIKYENNVSAASKRSQRTMGNAREVWDFFLQCMIAIVYSLCLGVSFINSCNSWTHYLYCRFLFMQMIFFTWNHLQVLLCS